MNSAVRISLLTLCCAAVAAAAPTAEQFAALPPPAEHAVSFRKEIQPILEESCLQCHARGKRRADFGMDTREEVLRGGDSGAAVIPGNSAESLLIHLVAGLDPDNVMPQRGSLLTEEQIGLLRAWIDQGLPWDDEVSFARGEPQNLKPVQPELPAQPIHLDNPIDRILASYLNQHGIPPAASVDDRTYARRVYLDVIGLLTTPEELAAFLADPRPDKRERLVQHLLEDNRNYAEHWLTFWNDMLRNDYAGTGYIDGGRSQITRWLYRAQYENMPYDEFVRQLVNPNSESEGFTKGIVWRGLINASERPVVQAAQNISQVFLGVNLKCASCHDSFIDDWRLEDAYGLAAVYSDEPLEMVECDKPLGRIAPMRFLYPELGEIDPLAKRSERLRQLSVLMTKRENGRLSRTIVNRLWGRFMGRALVEPVDDMERPAWNKDLLDWLAEDLVEHDYDLKHTIARILSSRAYQLPAVATGEQAAEYVFRGPLARRMSAEQFRDAIAMVTGVWYEEPAAGIELPGLTRGAEVTPALAPQWIWNTPRAARAAPAETIHLRRKVPLPHPPDEAVLVTTADNQLVVFVNGARVLQNDDWRQFSTVDIRHHLRPGENVIAVRATNDGVEPNPAGFLLYGLVRGRRGEEPVILDFVSDREWVWSEREMANWTEQRFDDTGWRPVAVLGGPGMRPWNIEAQFRSALASTEHAGRVRAALVRADPLQVALGRPNREQVITVRPSVATTLEALELTNGALLAGILERGAERIVASHHGSASQLIERLYVQSLGRQPSTAELALAAELVGAPARREGVEDLLWALAMLPEFQLIY